MKKLHAKNLLIQVASIKNAHTHQIKYSVLVVWISNLKEREAKPKENNDKVNNNI